MTFATVSFKKDVDKFHVGTQSSLPKDNECPTRNDFFALASAIQDWAITKKIEVARMRDGSVT